MGRLLRFGSARKLEAFCEREYGKDCVDTFFTCGNGLTVPVPIMGMGAAVYKDTIIPRTPTDLSFRARKNWKRNLITSDRGGFASLSDLISEATTGGKMQTLQYYKIGVAPGATAGTSPLWNVGNLPSAGGVGGTSGTGSVPTNSTTGSLKQANAGAGDTLHLTTWTGLSTVAGSVLLYDRLWHMTYNHATATSTNVDASNRPTRYQTTTAAGNFLTHEVTTVLSATAHTLTITYVDDNGNTAEAGAAKSVRVSSAVQTILYTAPEWTYNLNAGDLGLRYITIQAQSTITSVTGVSSAVIGHPLAILPLPVANIGFILDGVNSAFNLVQVLDGACLAMMDFQKTGNTAATMQGTLTLVSG